MSSLIYSSLKQSKFSEKINKMTLNQLNLQKEQDQINTSLLQSPQSVKSLSIMEIPSPIAKIQLNLLSDCFQLDNNFTNNQIDNQRYQVHHFSFESKQIMVDTIQMSQRMSSKNDIFLYINNYEFKSEFKLSIQSKQYAELHSNIPTQQIWHFIKKVLTFQHNLRIDQSQLIVYKDDSIHINLLKKPNQTLTKPILTVLGEYLQQFEQNSEYQTIALLISAYINNDTLNLRVIESEDLYIQLIQQYFIEFLNMNHNRKKCKFSQF